MKVRKFEVIRVFLSPIVGRIKYARKSTKWRKLNEHNFTTVSEWAPIDRITVGRYTYGKINAHWYGQEWERIQIGDYCSIAGEVHFVMGGEHNYKYTSTYPFAEKIYHEKIDGICRGPIVIKDDVWIGFGVIILSGVTIGQGCVIAAGSIVTKDVPPYSVWIGNRVKKKRFSEEIIEELLKIDYTKIEPEGYRTFTDEELTDENVRNIVEELTK